MIHLVKNRFLIITFVFIGIQSALATDYYCDPVNGNMINNGTQENPWASLESVFKDGKQFNSGDRIYLLAGNHGNVTVVGENTKYIKIIGVVNATVKSLIFGSDIQKAVKWTVSNISISNSLNDVLVFIHSNSSKIRLISNQLFSTNNDKVGIDIQGGNCKIENNIIHNIATAIRVSSQKNQLRNNNISFFSKNAIEISGDYNLLEYNLIKESFGNQNTAILIKNSVKKGSVIRGNTIINFVNPNRKYIGILNGIFAKDIQLSESIFENNVIITNSENGISISGDISNSKIVNNTIVNPYFGLEFDNAKNVNVQSAIKILGSGNSTNLVIQNNLVNNLIFENVTGLADHNLVLPVNVHDYDRCFQSWALFDFSLNKDSRAMNNGTKEFAPKMDASLNKRSFGNFVNIGAFELAKINEANETFSIIAEISDRQIHSKGKGDWDGQPQIRVGGTGKGIDGAGVFPFKLPLIPGGKEIISTNLNMYLKKVDNKPKGGIDVYGLAPKSNFWVTEDMYYQGTFGQDLMARPLQNNFVDARTYEGEVKMNAIGKSGLKSYINTVLENGSKAGDYIFLRLNPSSEDVEDYNRWNFISTNSDKTDKHPKLEIVIGYPALKKVIVSNIKEVKNTIATTSNPINNGNINIHLLGFQENDEVKIKLFTYKGKEVLSKTLQLSEVKNNIFRTKNLKASTGKYLFEYTIDGVTKKQTIFIW